MAKHSLKLLFLRKYRTSKRIYRQLKSNGRKTFDSLLPTSEHEKEESNFQGAYKRNTEEGRARIKRPTRKYNSQVDSVDCCFLIYDCVSNNKLRTFVFVVIVGLLSSTGLYLHNQRILQYRIYREDVFSPRHGIRLKKCTLPVLRPFSSQVKPYIGYTNKPNCVVEQRGPFENSPPFALINGSILERIADESQVESAGCCYRPFHRGGEGEVWSSNFCTDIVADITLIPNEYDYIEILCVKEGSDFRDGFALVHKKDQVEDRIAQVEEISPSKSADNNEPTRLSVIILGLDATSRMNFIRAMPNANKYLLKNLSAISLNGYTKVAENTLPNLIPFLTGMTLEEFKHICVDAEASSSQVHLDECPFIWKTFAENGYRTSFSEDDVNIGIFNMNWANAFASSPVDYYLRPFSTLMQKHHSFKDGYCYGPALSFEKLLEYIKSMAEVFDRDPYFQFTWSTKLSHDDLNKMRWGDESLYNFLQYLHTRGYLNNAALLVIGDHGSRLDRIRSTPQGKLEDRMPVAYFVLPEWFKTKYNRAYQNLKGNANRVTSAFDIHKTLYDLINIRKLEKPINDEFNSQEIFQLPNNETVNLEKFRGASLFQELPENRTCFSAGVPLHWCVCHRKLALEENSEKGAEAASFVVDHINHILKGESCANLQVKSVDEVLQWDPSEIIREGCPEVRIPKENATASNVDAGKEPGESLKSTMDKECNATLEVFVIQVAFTTSPSDATFETTVIQLQNGLWRLTEDVVRTNSYEGQSDCVDQLLKPYCFCSDSNPVESFFEGWF